MTRVVLDLPDGVASLLESIEPNLTKEFLVRFVVTLYGEGKVSLGKAVEISGLPYVDHETTGQIWPSHKLYCGRF